MRNCRAYPTCPKYGKRIETAIADARLDSLVTLFAWQGKKLIKSKLRAGKTHERKFHWLSVSAIVTTALALPEA